ncbi:LD-carboxypeptidase [Candidatus Nomurabacteria bacterium]|nr:LD-carboxypeptidase [Candidatus Kaiserbacteria bacterium]MCB9811117.1 LD-carboxypeptidase [Candidatus Nomurabacteria bacterium]MCB9814447.1 LD-carboxypeptidase [Candidatus Nomurabacteria bacterium]
MKKLSKLKKGDKVAILSPSFAAPGVWPHVYKLGLDRLQSIFGLVPVEYPATAKLDATWKEKVADLEAAFADPDIKAVITTLGGDVQVTYVKHIKPEVFVNNPKPFFGFSDNSHLCNFLFLNSIPSFYGAALFTQFAKQGAMDEYTIEYIKRALFDEGEFELVPSEKYNDSSLSDGDQTLINWNDPESLSMHKEYEVSDGWFWDGEEEGEGLLWGGCLESVDEMLRHGVAIPTLEQFEDIVLMIETSEEIPTANYVGRVFRALGERGIIARVKGVLVGRPKAWEFDKPQSVTEKAEYRARQREVILQTVRQYNGKIPVVQNLNFGHTDPQVPMPYGGQVSIKVSKQKIFARF